MRDHTERRGPYKLLKTLKTDIYTYDESSRVTDTLTLRWVLFMWCKFDTKGRREE